MTEILKCGISKLNISASRLRTLARTLETMSTGRVHQAQTLYTAPIPGVVCESSEIWESSSASGDTKDNESTAKVAGDESLKVSEIKLGLRRANQDATSDDKLASVVETQLPDRPPRDTEDF